MVRFLLSFIAALIVGRCSGCTWAGCSSRSSTPTAAPTDWPSAIKDEYTVMVANAYLDDSDLTGALERMRLLGVENVPAYIQDTTERYITNSSDVTDIRALVALVRGVRSPDADHAALPDRHRAGAKPMSEEIPSRYQRPRRFFSLPGILLGLILGIAAGLFFTWNLAPVQEFDTEPWQLKADAKDQYIVAIALNYAHDGDLGRSDQSAGQLAASRRSDSGGGGHGLPTGDDRLRQQQRRVARRPQHDEALSASGAHRLRRYADLTDDSAAGQRRHD